MTAPPGPGSWVLDVEHCERPRSPIMWGWFDEVYTEGFREGLARYGVLLDTIEARTVDGFVYTCIRPLGAPPEATHHPPWFVFKALSWLHPALRARQRQAAVAMEKRLWREDAASFERTWASRRKRLAELASIDLAAGTPEERLAHLRACLDLSRKSMRDHFGQSSAALLPVGDLVVHLQEWTGCSVAEALQLLRGASPASVDAVDRVEPILAAGGDALLDRPAHEVVDLLRTADGELGEVGRRWLLEVGGRVVTGHDPSERTAIEMPEVLVRTLKQRAGGEVAAPPPSDLGERVPAEHREAFDALMAEARIAYGLRDARAPGEYWTMGLLRKALLAVGEDLVARGAAELPEHAMQMKLEELDDPPSASVLAERAAHQASRTCLDMPALLGPEPGPPLPGDWVTGAAGRVHRAIMLYVDHMFARTVEASDEAVRGVGAAPGRTIGPARIVRGPADFERIEPGDVLVARITSPAYNVVLPLLRAVVTERGGLLSHPAIVAREFGIPSVVSARGALDRLPDGARVEVDGVAGTVRVLA